MRAVFSTTDLARDIRNIVKYSEGFIEGAQRGKSILLQKIGANTIELLKQYIDSNARVNPELLHHIYEWNETGSPSARLFDIDYTVSGLGLSFKSSFRQSTTIKSGSNVPFYNKAKIMEDGIPVVIRPKNSEVLRFEVDGETVYTRKPVSVQNPGGATEGQFQKVVDEFFLKYFTQTFLLDSGMFTHIKNPVLYKKNFAAGAKMGKSKGVSTGFKWITNIDRIV